MSEMVGLKVDDMVVINSLGSEEFLGQGWER
jgi:hypothetical protein